MGPILISGKFCFHSPRNMVSENGDPLDQRKATMHWDLSATCEHAPRFPLASLQSSTKKYQASKKVNAYLFAHAHTDIYIYIHVYKYIHTYIYIYIFMYVCKHVCAHIYIYTQICICVCARPFVKILSLNYLYIWILSYFFAKLDAGSSKQQCFVDEICDK